MTTTNWNNSYSQLTAATPPTTPVPSPAPTASPHPGEGPAAAGVALHAADTGRVLFIQRQLINGDPAGGLWEIPGGCMDEGETPWDCAVREFGEETGQPLPDGVTAGTWMSPNGVYQGFVHVIPHEADMPLPQDGADGDGQDPESPEEDAAESLAAAARAIANPDGATPNCTESMAWMDPAHLDRGPRLLRPEMRTGTPWNMLKSPPAGPYSGGMSQMASGSSEIIVTVKPQLDLSELCASLIGRSAEQVEMLAEGFGSLVAAAPELNAANRRKWASEGVAMPDGSFPIPDCSFVEKALHRIGSSNHPADAVRAHIRKRAKALGCKMPDSLTASGEEDYVDQFDSLVASLAQPASALLREDPLPGPTPWTIADDGTADGHLALWASCHIGYPGCVTPPREDSFDFYNLGDAVTADGRHVPVGKVTVNTGHAGPDLSWRTAAAHYDESGTAVAAAHAVADKWGIRLPAVLVADATGPQIDAARRSPLSGDWRRINGKLRLVAALGVNVPGYPIPRALVASGEVQSMFVGFNPEDAAAVVLEADSLAASIGLDPASRAAALRAGLSLPA